jgi:hypothetical protein
MPPLCAQVTSGVSQINQLLQAADGFLKIVVFECHPYLTEQPYLLFLLLLCLFVYRHNVFLIDPACALLPARRKVQEVL